MANTGKKIVLTLKEVGQTSGTPTGNTKNNVVGQPDYIAPYTDETACPVTYNTDCPTILVTGGTGTIVYEFNLFDAVLENPSVAKVKVVIKQSGTEVDNDEYIFPHISYFGGVFSGLAANTYTLEVLYINSSESVIQTCPYGTNITVS